MRTISRRLSKLETALPPTGEPETIQIVFVLPGGAVTYRPVFTIGASGLAVPDPWIEPISGG